MRLGKTNLEVNKNGFGALPIQRCTMTEAVEILQKAYENIINEKKIIPVIEPKVDVKNINEKEVESLFYKSHLSLESNS